MCYVYYFLLEVSKYIQGKSEFLRPHEMGDR